jgi:hypothetical protein
MANQYSNISLQTANQIVFKQFVTTDSATEFTNGITDILAPYDDEVENTFNVEGKSLTLICNSVMSWYGTTGSAAFLTTSRAGSASTTILLDDNTVMLANPWNQKAVFEINNFPFSKITIKNRLVIEGAKSVYTNSGTLTDGSSNNALSLVLNIK